MQQQTKFSQQFCFESLYAAACSCSEICFHFLSEFYHIIVPYNLDCFVQTLDQTLVSLSGSREVPLIQ
jgi:hypothetical protein